MSFDAETLLGLLPALYRLRDEESAAAMEGLLTPAEAAELAALSALDAPTPLEQQRANRLRAKASRGPLASLLEVFAAELAVLEESFAQLYDDFFIETCADWMIPYIGDLVGYEPLHPLGQARDRSRSEVARTIALRRRKGTAPVLEQLAQDGIGLPARAVEYFQRLIASQHMNHLRPMVRQTPDLRRGADLAWLGTPFETAQRSVDVRPIDPERGRHNIPHVGIHLWRIEACPRTQSSVTRVGSGRYRASPLGHDTPLFQRPEREEAISHLTQPQNVPLPLGRRYAKEHLERLYGPPPGNDTDPYPSLCLWVKEKGEYMTIDRAKIRICHLGDDGLGWAHTPPPAGFYAIDPVLGRIVLPASIPDPDDTPAEVRLSWHEGFTAQADLGGGEYDRPLSVEPGPDGGPTPLVQVPVPATLDSPWPVFPTIADALQALGGQGIVEITDNATHSLGSLTVAVNAESTVTIRAANRFRPVLLIDRLTLEGEQGSCCVLEGLLITGGPVLVDNRLERLELRHCTLVPGLALRPDGSPRDPLVASLTVTDDALKAAALKALVLERCIVGAIRAPATATLQATACLIDATAPTLVALMGSEPASGSPPVAGPELTLLGCTVIGRIFTAAVDVISDCILLAAPGAGWAAPVRAARRQVGCVRFSWIPPGSRLPAPFHCLPKGEAPVPARPVFTSLRYGNPAYGRLSRQTPDAILSGGTDDGEMGVFHHLWMPQRENNLRLRIAEYLRVGLSAGIFYES